MRQKMRIKQVSIEELQAQDVAHSAEIALSVLKNEASPFQDMALLTCAGALVAAGVCDGFEAGLALGARCRFIGSSIRGAQQIDLNLE